MALRDKFEKMISYFDTDEVSDVEELENSLPQQEERTVSTPASSSVSQERQSRDVNQSSSAMQRQTQSRSQQRSIVVPSQERVHRDSASSANQYRREQMTNQQQRQQPSSQPTIALKYPRKYEDATEIVDLLAGNECVLIDFQYMLEAQARRCLDFVDGASRVLSGNLQKVGSSMYLLTPQFVVVDVEEMTIPNAGQDVNFDYDMKRR